MSNEDTMDSGQMGWIVSWQVPQQVPLARLRDGLKAAGMNEELAVEMTPQNALRRALRDMSQNRVIRKLRRDGEKVFFQVTHEDRQERQIDYWREAEVCLDGDVNVTCDVPSIAQQAANLLREHLAKRLTTDLTRLLQRAFDAHKADLVPIREQGGAYFVPQHCADLVNQSRILLADIGGNLRSFAVRLGCGDTKSSVAESLSIYLADLVTEFRGSLEGISSESRSDVIERRSGRICELRQKLATYRGLLSGYAETIQADIEAADKQLLEAVASK